MIANFGFSQSNTRLQGPAAKNAKLWRKKDANQVYVAIERTNRHELKGPLAKNFKPWMLSSLNEIDTIAIKDRDSSKIKSSTE